MGVQCLDVSFSISYCMFSVLSGMLAVYFNFNFIRTTSYELGYFMVFLGAAHMKIIKA